MPDTLNLAGNERVDLSDLGYATSTSQLAFHRAIVKSLMLNSGQSATLVQQLWVIQGFTATAAGQSITVANGQAILAYRQGAQVFYGVVTSPEEGSASQTLDLTQLQPAAGNPTVTFGVYVRFNYVPGAYASRTFWNSQNAGSEYSQTTPTRLVATWELRVEASNPGGEWLRIGSVILASGANAIYQDQRPLYFEGRVDLGYNNTAGYAPEGTALAWGLATNDRSPDRATYGVRDMQTFTAAMRTCLEDIKGPGLVRWWHPYVAGQNIGFAGTPTAGRSAWFDAGFFAQGNSTAPYLQFGGSQSGQLGYARASNQLTMSFNGAPSINVNTIGISSAGDAAVVDALTGSTAPLQANAASAGSMVGFGLNKAGVRGFTMAYANAYAGFGFTAPITGPVLRSASDPLHFMNGSLYAGQLIRNAAATAAQWIFCNGAPSRYTFNSTNQALGFVNIFNDPSVTPFALWAEGRSPSNPFSAAIVCGNTASLQFLNNNNANNRYGPTNILAWQNNPASQAWSFAWVDNANSNQNIMKYDSTSMVMDLSGSARLAVPDGAASLQIGSVGGLSTGTVYSVAVNLAESTGSVDTSFNYPTLSGSLSAAASVKTFVPLHVTSGFRFEQFMIGYNGGMANVTYKISIGMGGTLSAYTILTTATFTTSNAVTTYTAATNLSATASATSGPVWCQIEITNNSGSTTTWRIFSLSFQGTLFNIQGITL